nr:hypothetical protein [uncultured Dysosmobacter sp.]
MLKYMIDGRKESLELNGDLLRLAAETTRLIQLVHGKLKRSNPRLADAYRQLIQAAILEPNSPVFSGDNAAGNVQDIVIITPKRKDGKP